MANLQQKKYIGYNIRIKIYYYLDKKNVKIHPIQCNLFTGAKAILIIKRRNNFMNVN